jgi:hypothetical protein
VSSRSREVPTGHRDIGHQEFRILEVVGIETTQVAKSRWDLDRPLVEGHMAEIQHHRRLGASGNRHSRGQRHRGHTG